MTDILELVSKLSEIKGNLERKWEPGTQKASLSVALTAEALVDTIDTIDEISKHIINRLSILEERCAKLEKGIIAIICSPEHVPGALVKN